MAKKTFWKPGQRAQIAKHAGIKLQHLSEILHRKRGVSQMRSVQLQKASSIVLGERMIPWTEWVCNKVTAHPAFFGKPHK